jgi:hypothetical protein
MKSQSQIGEIQEKKALNMSRKAEMEAKLRDIRAQELQKRVDFARSAKIALKNSISLAKDILEEEKQERRETKHAKTVQMPLYTSSKVRETSKFLFSHPKMSRFLKSFLFSD